MNGPRREATCQCCCRNDAPQGDIVCASCKTAWDEIERLRKIETKYRTVCGALERGNIRQARIWCGLPMESA